MKRLAFGALLGLVAATPSGAHELEARCRQFGIVAPVCNAVATLEQGSERTGVTFADLTDDPVFEIDIADFYFAPRIFQIYDGTRVIFRNANPVGGNRHSLSSSDLAGPTPIVPPRSFGGGGAFRSGLLRPGDVFILDVYVARMDPRGPLPTGLGDHLIGFHCYVHGATQMSGLIRVLPRL